MDLDLIIDDCDLVLQLQFCPRVFAALLITAFFSIDGHSKISVKYVGKNG